MSGDPSDGPAKDPRASQDPGWRHGLQPGIGTGGEVDKAASEGAPEADPAVRSPLPGFVDRPDSTEAAIEGEGVSQVRNATEDLPRQG